MIYLFVRYQRDRRCYVFFYQHRHPYLRKGAYLHELCRG